MWSDTTTAPASTPSVKAWLKGDHRATLHFTPDPIIHIHASALLTGQGQTSIVLADLRDPASILTHHRVRVLIGFGEPTALILV